MSIEEIIKKANLFYKMANEQKTDYDELLAKRLVEEFPEEDDFEDDGMTDYDLKAAPFTVPEDTDEMAKRFRAEFHKDDEEL